MARTKEIVYFPVCCLTTVPQNSETSEFSILVFIVVICETRKTENYITDISLRILTLTYCVILFFELEHGPCYSLWI